MLNKLTSAYRYLRREYPLSSAMTLGLAIFGAGFGMIVGAAAGMLSMGLLLGAMTGGIALVSSYLTDEPGHRGKNSAAVGGCTVTGAVRDVAAIVMTQRVINSFTDKLRHLSELPPKTARKIAAHIADVEGPLSRCRFYTYDGRDFCFTRPVLKGTMTGWAAVSAPVPTQRDIPDTSEEASGLPPSGALAKEFKDGTANDDAAPGQAPSQAPAIGPRR